jgi:hypothetical protein
MVDEQADHNHMGLQVEYSTLLLHGQVWVPHKCLQLHCRIVLLVKKSPEYYVIPLF